VGEHDLGWGDGQGQLLTQQGRSVGLVQPALVGDEDVGRVGGADLGSKGNGEWGEREVERPGGRVRLSSTLKAQARSRTRAAALSQRTFSTASRAPGMRVSPLSRTPSMSKTTP